MSQTRKSYPPLPGQCFASFSWQLQRGDGDRYISHVALLDPATRQLLTRARWEFVTTTVTRQVLEDELLRVEDVLRTYMADMFDVQLPLFGD